MKIAERLILFGGGRLPEQGLRRFFDWAEERSAKETLIITWASEEPPLTSTYLQNRFKKFTDQKLTVSLEPPTTDKERSRFLSLLERADALFFSGGDQNRVAWGFDHPEIGDALRAVYRSGVPVAGTSAGTAIMSELMICGELDCGSMDPSKVQTRQGLGLLEGAIVDQHFLKRQRQNRLFSLVLKHPEILGIGVDEDTGLALLGGRYAEVVGPERVMLVEAGEKNGSLKVDLLEEGQLIDLGDLKSRVLAEQVAS